jgi:pimeloyl-ACP methyl ester carboxylesterase
MHDAAQWDAVSKRLDNLKIKHVVLDFPGFGSVASDELIVEFKDLVTWSKTEIQHLTVDNDEPVTLLGHSCGGRIALALAVDNTDYHQLILVGSPNLYRPGLKVRIIKVITKLAAPVKFLFPTTLRRKLRSDDYDQAKESNMNELYRSVVINDQTALTSRVSTKVNLLWGEHDPAAPVHIAYELDKLLVDSTLTILPNLGHNLHQENPGLLAATINAYLTHD